jgi:hypothetical protein
MRWVWVIALAACRGHARKQPADAASVFEPGQSYNRPCKSFDPATLTPQEKRMPVVPWPCPDAGVPYVDGGTPTDAR